MFEIYIRKEKQGMESVIYFFSVLKKVLWHNFPPPFSVISETAMAVYFIISITFYNRNRLFKGFNCPLGWTFNIAG